MNSHQGRTKLGKEITDRLTAANLNQVSFCQRTGMKPATLSSLIRGGTELNNNHISSLRLVFSQDIDYWLQFRPNKISENMSAKDQFNSKNKVKIGRNHDITIKAPNGYEVSYTSGIDNLEDIGKLLEIIARIEKPKRALSLDKE